MRDFSFQEKRDADKLLLAFEGNIDEDVKFPQVDLSGLKSVFIDLNGVKAINSVGIREWLNWIKPLAEKVSIVLFQCPKAMVFQFNMVEGFLPKGTLVKSFYVPFYCDKCDKEENVLFSVGDQVQLSPGEVKLNFDVKNANLCAEPDCEMEMDATEAKYFQFLRKMVG